MVDVEVGGEVDMTGMRRLLYIWPRILARGHEEADHFHFHFPIDKAHVNDFSEIVFPLNVGGDDTCRYAVVSTHCFVAKTPRLWLLQGSYDSTPIVCQFTSKEGRDKGPSNLLGGASLTVVANQRSNQISERRIHIWKNDIP